VWGLCVVGVSPAAAENTEHRHFRVLVDGRDAGTYRMTITGHTDGSVTMTAQADVRVSFLVYRYVYSYQGTEVWHGKQLRKIESRANDDGKQMSLSATREGSGLRIRANGRERHTSSDLWPTTYWQLPDAKSHNGPVALLDADTGREVSARFQFIDSPQLTIAGRAQPCRRFRLTGPDLQVDLWYDNRDRLVRQESIEEGHRTVLELRNVWSENKK
jgi:hypothetical protein